MGKSFKFIALSKVQTPTLPAPPLPGCCHYTLFLIFCKSFELLVVHEETHLLFSFFSFMFLNKRVCGEEACDFLAFRHIFNDQTVEFSTHQWCSARRRNMLMYVAYLSGKINVFGFKAGQ